MEMHSDSLLHMEIRLHPSQQSRGTIKIQRQRPLLGYPYCSQLV